MNLFTNTTVGVGNKYWKNEQQSHSTLKHIIIKVKFSVLVEWFSDFYSLCCVVEFEVPTGSFWKRTLQFFASRWFVQSARQYIFDSYWLQVNLSLCTALNPTVTSFKRFWAECMLCWHFSMLRGKEVKHNYYWASMCVWWHPSKHPLIFKLRRAIVKPAQ